MILTETQRRQRRLSLLSLICLVLLIPTTLAWLVNLELALRVLRPDFIFLEPLLPAALFHALARFAADLSTISTLVPVLLLGFPAFMARRLRRLPAGDTETLRTLVYDPYPPHFPFFLVMLGLTGTLYGLLIGLDTSGVAELGAQAPTPEQIQQTLDQLLGGTATALLSSLLGLVGAFLAARPLTWLFHRVAGIPADPGRTGLADALQRLTADLHTLGEASRTFGERLQGTAVEDIPVTLKHIETAITGLQAALADSATEQRQAIGQGLDTLNATLGGAVLALAETKSTLVRQTDLLEALVVETRTAAGQAEAGRRTSGEQRAAVVALLEMAGTERARDRAALRRAVSQWLPPDADRPPPASTGGPAPTETP